MMSKVRLEPPPPVKEAPTNVNELNLPEEPEEDGWLGGDETMEPDDD